MVTVVCFGCLATDPPVDDQDVPDLVTFEAVDVGALHACGLTTTNRLLCWGENSTGQLGTGDNVFRTVPWPVSHGSTEFDMVSAGVSHSCAASVDGELYCWGSNIAGQLGLGDLGEDFVSVPNEVGGGGRTFSTVAAGGAHSCALTTGRFAFCWGNGSAGQLGTGYLGNVPRPFVDSVLIDVALREITLGTEHTCGMTNDGEVYCWGLGLNGRLGVGATGNFSEPTRVAPDMQFFAIDAGGNHTCALALDGIAYCWGAGNLGQLGTGGLDDSDVPVEVAGGLLFDEISAGDGFTCGVIGDGTTYCWGRNEVGQLGDGTLESRYEPSEVGFGQSFQTVSAGLGSFGSATCGLASNGLVYCWGDGRGGQTGTGESMVVTSPVRVYGQEG